MIQYRDWYIWTQGQVVARQFDHMTRSLEVVGELPEGWEWTAIVRVGEYMDYLPLTRTQEGASITLTAQQLALPGMYSVQLRGKQGELVRHTNVLSVYVPASLSGDANWPEVPSEFTRLEQRVLSAGEQAADTARQAEAAAAEITAGIQHFDQVVGGALETIDQARQEAGNGAADAIRSAADAAASEQAAERAAALAGSYTSHPPIIGHNGNWLIWDGTQYTDSGKPSQGELSRAQGNAFYANALKGTASGTVVRVDDVSLLEHMVWGQVSGAEDPTAGTLTAYGKNLCPTASITTKVNPAGYINLAGMGHGTYTLSADITKYSDDTATNTRMGLNIRYADGTSKEFRGQIDALFSENDGVTRRKSVTATTDTSKTIVSFSLRLLDYSNDTGVRNAKAENIQLEFGDADTGYEPYVDPVNYIPAGDGTCAVASLAPTMTLLTATPGVTITCEYNRDINKAFEQLQQAIISMGGNV